MVFFLKSKFVLNIEMDYAILFCEVRKMKKISDVDKNFKIKTTIKKDDVKFYDIKKSPFSELSLYLCQKSVDRVCVSGLSMLFQ